MLDILKQVGFAPRACVWELTLACNLRCKHCGSFAGSRRDDEMTLEESFKVADDLAALGCRRVTLSGGEPTLNPDWDKIGKRLADHCIKVNLISNGWHWTASHVERAPQREKKPEPPPRATAPAASTSSSPTRRSMSTPWTRSG